MSINLEYVATAIEVDTMLAVIKTLLTFTPSRFIELEVIKLCRYGSMSLFGLVAAPIKTVYLIDTDKLGYAMFHTFDTYGIFPQRIVDLHPEVMDLACCRELAADPIGLCACYHGSDLCFRGVTDWGLWNARSAHLFPMGAGIGCEVFDRKPLPSDLAQCRNTDAIILRCLEETYTAKLNDFWHNEGWDGSMKYGEVLQRFAYALEARVHEYALEDFNEKIEAIQDERVPAGKISIRKWLTRLSIGLRPPLIASYRPRFGI